MRAIAFLMVCAVAGIACSCATAREASRRDLTEGMDANTPGPELFLRAYEVFSHSRCANCHPRDDRPRWGETGRLHAMNVQRGQDRPPGHESAPEGAVGRPGMNCPTCHQERNGALPGSPPGAPHWRLAPLRMGWLGMTPVELCRQFKAQAQRDHGEEIDFVIGHIVEPKNPPPDWSIDPLVLWAWEPGTGRQRAPGTVEQFVLLLEWWREGGAACPTD